MALWYSLEIFSWSRWNSVRDGGDSFNEALTLDKLGDHGDASKHFKVDQENANGNALILESKNLLAHIQWNSNSILLTN